MIVKHNHAMQVLPAASSSTPSSSNSNANTTATPHHSSNAATAARIAGVQGWGSSSSHLTLPALLLHDSIPCVKRLKKHVVASAAGDQQQQQLQNQQQQHSIVDLACCINVLFGTLLKLYDRGAKVPTFTSRVALASRLAGLQCMPPQEQSKFLSDHPSLVRMCFMEYSLNALQDWLPCERELLVQVCPTMETYFRVAVCMCDIFR